MTLTVEAIYENGVLKPAQPLPLKEHEKVQITLHTAVSRVRMTAGLIPCRDAKLIERIAEDDEFPFWRHCEFRSAPQRQLALWSTVL